ncbi:MAG: FHA domain-containing serine/threonine-protein kinase [Planctomycetota bacterium]
MPKLVIEKGPNKSAELSLGKTVFVGRDSTAHIVLTEPMISRLHFKVENRLDGYYIIDLGSLNGTFVNRVRVKERLLEHGDMIQVGDIIISFVLDTPEMEERNLLGKIIGGYRIIEKIGRGGMGTVYKALQISLNRIVALKILSEDMVKDKTFIEMFLQEARSAAQLNHNNIVQVYDTGRWENDTYYFSMEYMPNGSIQELLMEHHRLSPFQATKQMLDAANGLQYAEKKGIVHRDIKPDNLMIGEDDIVKIGDLGLAKNIYSPATEQSNNLMGTPHYLAPEQAQVGQTVDHRADIYSLGGSFYRILAGSTPYSGASVKEIIRKKLKEDPPPLKKLEPSLPDSVVTVVDKMMKRDMKERYQNSTELIKDLNKLKEELNPDRPAIKTTDSQKAGGLPEAEKILQKSFIARIVLPVVLIVVTLLAAFFIISYYKGFSRGKTPPVVVNPNIPPTTPNNYEEELARQLLKEADSTKIDINNKNSILQGIQSYEGVINKCPNSQWAINKAQDRINQLKENYKKLEDREQQILLEKKNMALCSKLEEDIDERFQKMLLTSNLELVGIFMKDANKKLDEFGQANSVFPSITGRIKSKKDYFSQWYAQFQKAGERYLNLKKEVETFVNNDQFESAFKLIIRFRNNKDYHNTIYDNITRDYYKDIEKTADRSFQAVMQQIDAFINQDLLNEAYQSLLKILGSYGVESIENKIKEKMEWFKSQEVKMHKQLLDKESAKFTEIYLSLLWFLQAGQFDELNATQQEANSQFQTKEYKDTYSDFIFFIESEKNILKEFINKLNEKNTLTLRGKEVLSINNGLINFRDSAPLKWEELTALDWAVGISNGWKLTARQYFDLAILCIKRGGLDTKAEEYFRLAINVGQDNKIKALINKYKSQIPKLKKERDGEESVRIKEESDKLFDERNHSLALKGYLLLKYRYWNTGAYIKDRNFIEKRITECER